MGSHDVGVGVGVGVGASREDLVDFSGADVYGSLVLNSDGHAVNRGGFNRGLRMRNGSVVDYVDYGSLYGGCGVGGSVYASLSITTSPPRLLPEQQEEEETVSGARSILLTEDALLPPTPPQHLLPPTGARSQQALPSSSSSSPPCHGPDLIQDLPPTR